MAQLKSLLKDTAIYGISSIVGRFLNYLLVPLYTAKMSAESGGYGVITNVYAYTALLLVILTYGMETTFFRFINKEDAKANNVYSTTLISVGATSVIFIALVLFMLSPISSAMGYASHPEYIMVMTITVALDAFQSIPFAYLRYKKRPIKFASLKLIFIFLNIGLNIFYYVGLNKTEPVYAFYVNLVCTSFITLLFYKELVCVKYIFDIALLKNMLRYTFPLLLLGIAGILNQTADKIMFPYIYKQTDAHTQLGIYGAASKIAMIMAMITQAFRFAYEPFVFGNSKEKDNKQTYAAAMKMFVIFTLVAFLCVMGNMDILQHIIAKDYRVGLQAVPIIMMAEIMMGVYFNLSFWYKLTDNTIWGAILSGIGCVVLLIINVIFVPIYGYMACAWAGFAGYFTAMMCSYIVGQKKYKIPYDIKIILKYCIITAIAYIFFSLSNAKLSTLLSLIMNNVIIIAVCLYAIKENLPNLYKRFIKK